MGETQLKSVLTESERRIFSIYADTAIPPSDLIPHKPSDLKVVEQVDDLLAYSSSIMVKAFRFALHYLDMRAYTFRFSMRRFTEMEPSIREAYLKSWHQSWGIHRKTLIRLLEAYLYSIYYAQREVVSKLDFAVKQPLKNPSPTLYQENVILKIPEDQTVETQVCIIGSGAGGAPLAAELTKAGIAVVILEEGGRFDLKDFHTDPIQRGKTIYRDAGITTTMGVPPVILPLGRAIGGTTVINSGTCFRTPETIFKKWAKEYGLDEFNSQTMAPYYEQAERDIHVAEVPEALLGKSAQMIQKGFAKMGLHGMPLKRNAKGCEGSGLCGFGCPTDAKQSMQVSYIPQALEHGAVLYGNCKAEKLVSENGKITEIIAQSNDPLTKEKGGKLRIKAKLFVVAAGTIYTPLLLKGSKVGLASGQVGKHLTLHPASKAFALFDEEIRGWEGVPQSYYCEDFKEEGITFEGIFTPPSITATTLLLQGAEHKWVMEHYKYLASFGFMVTDESRGTVRRRLNGEPFITYSMTANDLKKMINGLVLLSRMFFEAGAKEIYLPIHSVPRVSSIEDASRLYAGMVKARDLEVYAFHPLGTCRMGHDPKRSVVNSYGKVHELENLFICDGSVFPTSLGVNPQLTIMAFALRLAEHLKEKYF